MRRWWRIPSWRRLTSRFRCWTRWRAARSAWSAASRKRAAPPKDIFNEIDFGSYFQEYLDPGYRTQPEYEDSDKPSFENFLSQPTTLSDHLAWQLGALSLDRDLHDAAEFVVGNLDEDGYLAASEEELAAVVHRGSARHATGCERPDDGPGRGARPDSARHRSGAASRSCRRGRARPAPVPAASDRSAAARVRPFVREAGGELDPDAARTRIAASMPRPKPRSRSGGAQWKWRR